MLKKISAIALSVFLTAFAFYKTVAFAAVVEASKITIATIDGITGDSVIVPINIEENPGISAITVSITYNSSALEFEEFINGNVLSAQEMGLVAHPSRNIIRFVTSEVGNKKGNGTLVSLKFKIKENAEATLHKIDIKYNQGDFCNWKLDKIMPTIVAGGINVAYNGSNCSHKVYGKWSVAAVPSCEEQGMDSRICKNCGHTDLRYNDPIGHEYSDIWTVDQEATPEQDGLMSRHCIRCSNYVDQISFKYEQSEDIEVDNSVGNQTSTNDKIEEIFKDQNPDKELSPNIPPTNNNMKPNNSSTSSSQATSSKGNSGSSSHSASSKPTVSQDQPKVDNKPVDKSKSELTTGSETDSIANSSTEFDSTATNGENSNASNQSEADGDLNGKEQTNQTDSEQESTIKTYLDKITDAFPKFEKITDTFKIFVIVLIFIIL